MASSPLEMGNSPLEMRSSPLEGTRIPLEEWSIALEEWSIPLEGTRRALERSRNAWKAAYYGSTGAGLAAPATMGSPTRILPERTTCASTPWRLLFINSRRPWQTASILAQGVRPE